MRKKRFTVKYSRVELPSKIYSVGTFSLRVQAEKLLMILAANPAFLDGEIYETLEEVM